MNAEELKALSSQWGAELLMLLITTVGGVAYRLVARFINTHVSGERTKNGLLKLNDVVFTVVSSVSQTTVNKLKQSLTDGKISRVEYEEALHQAKLEALGKTRMLLGPTGRAELKQSFGWDDHELGEAIAEKIESFVVSTKGKR